MSQLPPTFTYWVVPGKLLAGEYPGSRIPDYPKQEQKIVFLLGLGVNFFVDLTEPGTLIPYEDALNEQASLMGLKVKYSRFAIRDFGIPSDMKMAMILDAIDNAVAARQVVYIHCWAGVGRTGTVAGCYLVRHGLGGKAALKHLGNLRRDLPDAWRRSPESDAQWQMVINWKIGQ
jgi:protein-tyrosine phosphatase